jgi:peptidoglycan hydrolase-like protein with peptidoglycan-binding domain
LDAGKEGAASAHRSEIRKMQESLRDKGHYRGTIDGVFGLRTRAGIREYQKAEKWPVTGEVDSRTASGLGVRSDWGNAMGAGGTRRLAIVSEEPQQQKPSAGIKVGKARSRAGKKFPSE